MNSLSLNQMENVHGGRAIARGGSRRRMTRGCGLAIAGTLITTVGPAFVTGGASLIVFFIAKGIATSSVIDSCA